MFEWESLFVDVIPELLSFFGVILAFDLVLSFFHTTVEDAEPNTHE